MLRIMSLMLVPTYAQYQPPPSNYLPSTTNLNSGLTFDANEGIYYNPEMSTTSMTPMETGGTTFQYNPNTGNFDTLSSASPSSGLSSLLGNNMNYLPSSGMTSMGAVGSMNPMMGAPSMGGMNPMMGLHSPMGGMNPMMGGMNPMMGLHSPMGGMNPMMGLHSPMGGMNPMPPQFAPMSGSPFQSSNTFIPDASSPYATSVFGQGAGFGSLSNFGGATAPLPPQGTSSTPSFGAPSIGFGPSSGSSMMGGYGRPMGGYGGFPPFGGYGGSYGRPPMGGYGGSYGRPPMGGYGAGGYGFQSPQSMFSSSPMMGGYGSSMAMFAPMGGYGGYMGR